MSQRYAYLPANPGWWYIERGSEEDPQVDQIFPVLGWQIDMAHTLGDAPSHPVLVDGAHSPFGRDRRLLYDPGPGMLDRYRKQMAAFYPRQPHDREPGGIPVELLNAKGQG